MNCAQAAADEFIDTVREWRLPRKLLYAFHWKHTANGEYVVTLQCRVNPETERIAARTVELVEYIAEKHSAVVWRGGRVQCAQRRTAPDAQEVWLVYGELTYVFAEPEPYTDFVPLTEKALTARTSTGLEDG